MARAGRKTGQNFKQNMVKFLSKLKEHTIDSLLLSINFKQEFFDLSGTDKGSSCNVAVKTLYSELKIACFQKLVDVCIEQA